MIPDYYVDLSWIWYDAWLLAARGDGRLNKQKMIHGKMQLNFW